MDHRPRLVDKNTGAFYPISTFEDLKETLELMEMGASNVRSYLAVAYNQVFLPAFKAAKSKGVTKLERERYDGSQLCTELKRLTQVALLKSLQKRYTKS